MNNQSIVSFVAIAFFAGLSLAQNTTQTLEVSVKQALQNIASNRASLETAKADLLVKQSDPTTLVAQLLQSTQTVKLETVKFAAQRIEVLGNVSTAYFNLLEAQENLEVLRAQLALDRRNLEVTQVKLTQKNSTQLDVRKAQNTVASSRQNLANAQAQLPTLSNRLETTLGLSLKGDLRVSKPPKFTEIKFDLAVLEASLEKNLVSVLQSAQSVETNELNVRLALTADTLRDAKTELETAKRSFETAKKNAVISLRDSSRNVSNSLETVKLRQTDLQNDFDSLKQDQQRLKNGTISRVALQQTELAAWRSQYNLATAQNSYFKALNSLSSTAGVDVTGMLEKVGDAK